ncbi:hypothetical protein GCM10009579_88620 [Streptomyces javensis]|uniref:Diaminopimelate epimerase n=1 Tax=Streptomyces javensis TaxID=114698 RepID=A0ABP4I8D1_9ACTN
MTDPALHPFVKGHGAENDFVILPDPENHLILTPAEVARLCDRCTGLGADGILRAVRCAVDPEATAMTDAEWFMDYRNADGTRGAMCGNGLRLRARYLVDAGLHCPDAFLIATRAGTRRVYVPSDHTGPVTIDMGRPRLSGARGIEVTAAGRTWPATHVDMGNPHAVVFLEDTALAGDLRAAPTVTPAAAYPNGATVEFVTTRSPHHLRRIPAAAGPWPCAPDRAGRAAGSRRRRHQGPHPVRIPVDDRPAQGPCGDPAGCRRAQGAPVEAQRLPRLLGRRRQGHPGERSLRQDDVPTGRVVAAGERIQGAASPSARAPPVPGRTRRPVSGLRRGAAERRGPMMARRAPRARASARAADRASQVFAGLCPHRAVRPVSADSGAGCALPKVKACAKSLRQLHISVEWQISGLP